MNEEIRNDPKFNDAVLWIATEVGADIRKERERALLVRAIRYADLNRYSAQPKTVKEKVETEIFMVMASCYFRRKMLHPFNDIRGIDDIRKYEQFKVTELKCKLLN